MEGRVVLLGIWVSQWVTIGLEKNLKLFRLRVQEVGKVKVARAGMS